MVLETLAGLAHKGSAALAGFFGAAVSMAFLKPVSYPAALAQLGVGGATAHYATPIITSGLGIDTPTDGLAFFIGLTAMVTLPVCISGSVSLVRSFGEKLGVKSDGND